MPILFLAVFLILYPKNAWAYVDPGSIAILLQVIIAFLVGFLLAFRNRVRDFFKTITQNIMGKKDSPEEKKNDNNG